MKFNELSNEDSNFIWTQIKVQEFINLQQYSNNCVQHQQKKIFNQQSFNSIKKKQVMDPFLRLMRDDYEYKSIDRNQKAYMKFINQKNISLFKVNSNIKIHNHIDKNYHLGNKKAMYHNLKKYYELTKQDLNQIIPKTFHIQKGARDKTYLQFLEFYKKQPKGSTWIIKPGEFTNRGTGITVCQTLSEINKIVSKKQIHSNGKHFTYLIQKYYQDKQLIRFLVLLRFFQNISIYINNIFFLIRNFTLVLVVENNASMFYVYIIQLKKQKSD